MGQCSTRVKKGCLRKDATCKPKCWARPSHAASRLLKKRGADPPLRLRSQKGKSRTQSTTPDERRRRGRFHTPLLEMHLRRRGSVCSGHAPGRRRQTLQQDGAKTLLSSGC